MKDTFKIESGTMLITDPCYVNEPLITKRLNARNGNWIVDVLILSNNRVAMLTAKHVDYEKIIDSNASICSRDIKDMGVDSGQMGFFDAGKYSKHKSAMGEYDDTDKFYGKCCAATLSSKRYDVIDGFGCVSNSGYGDGSYDGVAVYDETGHAISVSMTFIDHQ